LAEDIKIYLGDRISVLTKMGDRGEVISHLPDGRVILFSRDSPYRSMIGPNQEIDCHVVHIERSYIIVEPIREPVPISRARREPPEIEPPEIEPPEIEPPEIEPPKVDKDLIKDLKKIVKKGGGGGTVARALLHIIERLDKLSRA
jgi:hypothetical protein